MKILTNKKLIKTITVAFAGTLLLTTVVNAAAVSKKIEATFRNIQVYSNNKLGVLEQEPFIYNQNVYLPVRAVGELVNKEITWNASTNSVFIADKGGAPSQNTAAELLAKDLEIARLMGTNSILDKRVKELEASIKDKDKRPGTSNDLNSTLGYITDFFDYEHSIDWDFKLSQTNSRINVEVSYDSRTDDKKWNNLTKAQRETFFKDIAREIRIDFKDTPVNGKVIDRRTDKTIGSFTYSTSNAFSYSDDSATSFVALEKDLKTLVKKIDGTEIPVDNIIIKGTEDNITFTVYIDLYSRTLQNDWQYAFEDNPREIRQVMEYIQEEILRDFKGASVQGFIEDLDSRNTLAKFDGRRLY